VAKVLEMPVREVLLREIETAKVTAGHNVRQSMSDESLKELVASVREHGILQPITVRENGGGKYEVVTGHRRLAAAKLAGLKMVPAVVRHVDERNKVLQQIIENVQREMLPPLDESLALHRYLGLTGVSQDKLAAMLGKSGAYVANVLSIARKLDREEKDLVMSLPEQPAKEVLIIASRTKDAKLRRAMLEGQYTAGEAREEYDAAVRRGRRGRPKHFTMRVDVDKNAMVTVSFRKVRVTKREVVAVLNQARTDVASRKAWRVYP